MKNRQNKLQVSIPVVLWFKSFLLLNGIHNMNIKDILTQARFDINKASKLYFKGSILVYEYEGKEIDIIFDYCRLRSTGKNELMVVIHKEYEEVEEGVQYIFLRDLETKKTILVKDDEETNRWIYFKKNEDTISFIDGNTEEYDGKFCFQDCMFSGLTIDKPYLIRLRITESDSYPYHIGFHFQKYGNDNFYDINSRNCIGLQEYLAGLTLPVSVEEVCTKICEFYAIKPEDIAGEYELRLAISKAKDNKLERVASYCERNGEIKVYMNDEIKEYQRTGKKLVLVKVSKDENK